MEEAVVSSSPLPQDLRICMIFGKRHNGFFSFHIFLFVVHSPADHCIEFGVIHNDLMMIRICAVTRNNEIENKQFLFGTFVAHSATHHILWPIAWKEITQTIL